MLLTPPSRQYLNASFSSMASLRRDTGEPSVEIHPADAAARGIAGGMRVRVRVRNDRGAFACVARISDRVRTGVVVAPSIWWQKLSDDGENANAVTSGALTDIGRGATHYDTAVEAAPLAVAGHAG